MCGIIGYSGKKDANSSDIKMLLLQAQARGSDSTGLATNSGILKKAVDARSFVKQELPMGNALIGHTRAKTTGRVCDKNSHPFENGNYIGVHNGIIGNFFNLKREEKQKDMEVDSEIIWHMFNKYGLREGIPQLKGSFALGWLDQDKNLNLYRHSNPIYIGFRDDALYFGSTKTYLETIGCVDIEYLSEHVHYLVSEGKIVEETDLSDCQPKSYTRSSYNGYGAGYNGHGSYGGTTTESVRKTHKPAFAPEDAKYIQPDNGPVVYYWFADTTETNICVEPVYPKLQHNWKETYQLDNKTHVANMFDTFPMLRKVSEIQDVISTQK